MVGEMVEGKRAMDMGVAEEMMEIVEDVTPMECVEIVQQMVDYFVEMVEYMMGLPVEMSEKMELVGEIVE
jgi:hypothetical protein